MQICTRFRCVSLGQAPDVCLHTSDKTGCRRYPGIWLRARLLAGAGEEVPQFMLDIQELDIQRDRRCDLSKKKVIRNNKIGEAHHRVPHLKSRMGNDQGPYPVRSHRFPTPPPPKCETWSSFQASTPALLPAPRWAERACDASLGVQTTPVNPQVQANSVSSFTVIPKLITLRTLLLVPDTVSLLDAEGLWPASLGENLSKPDPYAEPTPLPRSDCFSESAFSSFLVSLVGSDPELSLDLASQHNLHLY